jgi:phage terminase large subunit-like protein
MADPKAERAAYYNKHKRNPEAVKFYNSAAWSGPHGARTNYIREHPICERCGRVTADHVHHKIPFDSCTIEQRIDTANLQSVCISCHNVLTAAEPQPLAATAIGTIEPIEDDTYYFDNAAADRPIRFIQKFATHYEGKWAGKPFELLPWQRQLVRTIFGWKYRSTNLRRFREVYLMSAKGAGKTPLLSAIGLFMLLADNEPAAHVISMASSFEQAALTFNAAKIYIEGSDLSRHKGIDPKQYVIDAPNHSKWTTISGKPTGRSGPRPSCIIADERHEWPTATVQGFDLLCANLFKRQQPLLLIATNAGSDRTSSAWELHERAAGVLAGTIDDPSLLPVIFEAPKGMDWKSEEAARAANPSIPDVVTFAQIKPEQSKGEARYRRLYLSQWVTGSDKWLDLNQWDQCVKPLDLDATKGQPRYVGLDLSNGDDLCAMTDVYTTSTTYHVDSRFWIPRQTAERYETKDLHPYHQWSESKDINLLESPTISIDAQTMIAKCIVDEHERHPITAVCFDRAYSSGVIEIIRAAGIECRAIAQGWTLFEGCQELDRRLIEKSISIAPNSVMRFCASNVTVTTPNRHGQFWPVKPNRKGRAGACNKIDGISALVTALTEARKHAFPKQTAHVGAMMIEF